jgi:hypothetical protein
MPIRNPFAKRPGVSNGLDPEPEVENKPSFERVDTVGSKASSALSINSGKSQEPAEYKMSGNVSALTRSPSTPMSACSSYWHATCLEEHYANIMVAYSRK